VLQKEITFDIEASSSKDAIQTLINQIHQVGSSCAVHIRRGDYLDAENASMFGGIATEAYYNSAIRYVKENSDNPHFFIFSDDIEYVKEKYGADENCTIVDINKGEDSRFDIYLMSLCDMHICANSTFSFWGARLSKKYANALLLSGQDGEAKSSDSNSGSACINHRHIRIRPTKQKNSQEFDPELMRDLWNGWIFIDPEGRIYE